MTSWYFLKTGEFTKSKLKRSNEKTNKHKLKKTSTVSSVTAIYL